MKLISQVGTFSLDHFAFALAIWLFIPIHCTPDGLFAELGPGLLQFAKKAIRHYVVLYLVELHRATISSWELEAESDNTSLCVF